MLALTLTCALCAAEPDLARSAADAVVAQTARTEAWLVDTTAEAGQAPHGGGGATALAVGLLLLEPLAGYVGGVTGGHLGWGRTAIDWAGGMAGAWPAATLTYLLLSRGEHDDSEVAASARLALLFGAIPVATAGGIAAAEALQGPSVDVTARGAGAAAGALLGTVVFLMTSPWIAHLRPSTPGAAATVEPWWAPFAAGAVLGLVTSACGAGGYSLAFPTSR